LQQPLFTYTGPETPPTRDCPVFLPGWGFDGRVAGLAAEPRFWLTTSRPAGPAEIMAGLAEAIIAYHLESLAITGWSLGARLALDFALAHPDRVSALYLLAPRDLWSPQELAAIRQELAADPAAFLRTFYRKCFLGYRQEYRAFQNNLEISYLEEVTPATLEAGLEYLGQGRLTDKLDKVLTPGLPVYLLQGGHDVIAPPDLAATHPGAIGQFFAHGGHPLFLERGFNPEKHLRKAAIRDRFSRAAATYDDYAASQKEAALRLVDRLPQATPAAILELGCGTGNLTRLLSDRYPAARITALDFSERMLAVARAKVPEERVTFHCRDAELYLESCTERYDLVVANATLQWFDDLEQSLGRIAGCLKPGGFFAASIFGPATLRELRDGLAFVNPEIEIRLPVNDFPPQERLLTSLGRHFTSIAIEEWLNRRIYPDLAQLFRHIRRTGTTGPGRRTPLIDRPRFVALDQWFVEELGEYRLTYQIFLVSCSGPGKRT